MDIPNSRSSHTVHTPRGGGIAIVAGLLVGSAVSFFYGFSVPEWSLFLAVFVVFLTSLFDDRKSLPVLTRLALHSAAAGIVIYSTGGLKYLPIPFANHFSLGIWSIPLTYIWILAVLNIYNFLDGIDGFSASQALVAGIGISIIDWGGVGMVMGLLISISSLAFLFYNWHPAKVFMGDVGSITLGFLFASLPFYIKGIPSEKGVFAVVIFLWFFISDGVYTIVRRLLKGEKIWEAHRSHLFQRLTKTGLRHDQVTLRVMIPAVILIVFEIYGFSSQGIIQSLILAVSLCFFGLYVYVVIKREKKISYKEDPVVQPAENNHTV
ncbi:MAG: glycosyltransferase family 4 protein [Cytophagales bacterium]|nr:glycosyltransferase family 4 protein [Cytophagales bacterium]